MTTAKHTPGPWRLETWTYDDGARKVPTIQNDKDAVATVLDLWCMDNRTAERDANARLIAAAPALLEALDEAQAALDVLAGDIEDTFPARAEATADLAMRLRAAIAKASSP